MIIDGLFIAIVVGFLGVIFHYRMKLKSAEKTIILADSTAKMWCRRYNELMQKYRDVPNIIANNKKVAELISKAFPK